MILVDTSVWIDDFRQSNPRLQWLLEESRVVCHPFVTGELAVGNFRHRAEALAYLESLPQPSAVAHEEVLDFVESHALTGSGLGWIEVHLLCAATIDHCRLWTLDRRLAFAAVRLGVGPYLD